MSIGGRLESRADLCVFFMVYFRGNVRGENTVSGMIVSS